MLEIKNLSYSIDEGNKKKEILKNISLTLHDNETLVITGANGAGKSTLLKLIMGLATATSGQILLDGVDITKMSITERARLGVAYAFQTPVRFKGLKVRDVLNTAQNGDKIMDVCNYLSKVGLCAREYIDRELDDSLSGGEIKRIEVATILARKARINLFDEPEAGIDLWSMDGLIKCFNQSKTDNKSINIIVSHQEKILDIADKILVLDNKQIKEFGARNDILGKLKLSPTNCIRLNKEKTNEYTSNVHNNIFCKSYRRIFSNVRYRINGQRKKSACNDNWFY